MKKKIKYTIEKHAQLGKYIIWRDVESSHGFCTKGIFQGTRKECQEELEKIRGGK